MAAPAGKLFVLRLKVGLPRLIPVRWSRYNPFYVNPVINKEKYQRPLEEFSAEEMQEWNIKGTLPVKACPPSLSSSLYYDETVSKFTNMVMRCGNKILARLIVNKTLERIKRAQLEKYYHASIDERESIQCNPYVIFYQAIDNCKPIVGLGRVRRGGKAYQVPMPLSEKRRRFLAMSWIIKSCKEQKVSRIRMYEKLSDIILKSFNGEGNVIKKKNELHKMAEANRAYAHFRWR